MAKKILLADDSLTIQKVVELTFSDEDYDVTVVGDGAAAIQRIDEQAPDIVLADVMMPRRTGYEVCEHVKGNPATRHIPVLLLVGKFEPFEEERARQVGAAGHIVKPFESNTLVKRVIELLAAAPSPAGAAGATTAMPLSDLQRQETQPGAPDRSDTAQLDRPPSGAPAAADAGSPFPEAAPFPEAGAPQFPEAEAPFPEPAPGPAASAGSPFDDRTTAPSPGGGPFDEPSPFDEPATPVPPSGVTAASPFGEDEPAGPAPAASGGAAGRGAAAPEPVAHASQGAAEGPSIDDFPEDLLNAIVERVVRRMSEDVVREVTWQVVPELAELMIKKKLEELG